MTSPYPLPSPYPHLTFPLPSPNPLLTSSPFPFPGLTPNYPTLSQPTFPIPLSLPAAPSTSRTENEVGFDDVLRGLNEVELLLSRGEGVLREIKDRESKVFDITENGMLGSKSLQELHAECTSRLALHVVKAELILQDTQILQTLISTATTSLIAGLPVPLTAAIPSEAGNGVIQPTLQDLTSWAQVRAGLEFSRREGVRSAARGVGEILKLGGGR